MPLPLEMLALKARCQQALAMGASLAKVESYLAQVGAGPVPSGVSKEQHLLDALAAMDAGKKPELMKAAEPSGEPEGEAEEASGDEEAKPKKRRR